MTALVLPGHSSMQVLGMPQPNYDGAWNVFIAHVAAQVLSCAAIGVSLFFTRVGLERTRQRSRDPKKLAANKPALRRQLFPSNPSIMLEEEEQEANPASSRSARPCASDWSLEARPSYTGSEGVIVEWEFADNPYDQFSAGLKPFQNAPAELPLENPVPWRDAHAKHESDSLQPAFFRPHRSLMADNLQGIEEDWADVGLDPSSQMLDFVPYPPLKEPPQTAGYPWQSESMPPSWQRHDAFWPYSVGDDRNSELVPLDEFGGFMNSPPGSDPLLADELSKITPRSSGSPPIYMVPSQEKTSRASEAHAVRALSPRERKGKGMKKSSDHHQPRRDPASLEKQLMTPSWSSMSHSSSSSDHSLPYKCPHCDSTFRVRGYLTRHMKKHAEVKVYTCPFHSAGDENMCHPTGGFSRRDTYKMHLKARHFIYPEGTKCKQRLEVPGMCGACGELFANNEEWVEQHIQGRRCPHLKQTASVRSTPGSGESASEAPSAEGSSELGRGSFSGPVHSLVFA